MKQEDLEKKALELGFSEDFINNTTYNELFHVVMGKWCTLEEGGNSDD